MASYIVLGKFTEQGLKSVKESPDRAAAFKKVCEGMGVQMVGIHWTLGAYDIVAAVEGTDADVTAALLKLGMAGNVTTQTLRAYDADEFRALLRKI